MLRGRSIDCERLEELMDGARDGMSGARLAPEGVSNPEIGARPFMSPRTVQHHLRTVFAKLAISSRGQLDGILR